MKRDKRGRFIAGNDGHIGYTAMVAKHFDGNTFAQREWFRQLGLWNYERMADIDNAAANEAMHPGPIECFMVAWRALNDWRKKPQDVIFNL